MQTKRGSPSRGYCFRGKWPWPFSQKAPFHWSEALFAIPFPSSCSHSPFCCLFKAISLFTTASSTNPLVIPHSGKGFLFKQLHSALLFIFYTSLTWNIAKGYLSIFCMTISHPIFTSSVCYNNSLAFVFGHLYLGQKIIGCCVRSVMPSCIWSVILYPTCLSLSHYRDILYPFGLIQVKGPTPKQPPPPPIYNIMAGELGSPRPPSKHNKEALCFLF